MGLYEMSDGAWAYICSAYQNCIHYDQTILKYFVSLGTRVRGDANTAVYVWHTPIGRKDDPYAFSPNRFSPKFSRFRPLRIIVIFSNFTIRYGRSRATHDVDGLFIGRELRNDRLCTRFVFENRVRAAYNRHASLIR